MKTYQNSDVCKQSINFVTKIYQTISAFSNEEKFGLTSQLKRASISIPLNIAEGATRKGKIEFKQFLYIFKL